MTIRHARTLPAVAALALLAACSGSDPQPPADANETQMLDVTNEAMNVEEAPVVMNTPAPVTENATAAETAPPVPDEEQMRADAEATGMTARVNRDVDPAPAANQSQTVSEEK